MLGAVVGAMLAAVAARAEEPEPPRDPLERPLDAEPLPLPAPDPQPLSLASYLFDPALGFAGPSRVRPRSGSNDEFDTVEDRWRIGFPAWDRYGKDHPAIFDYPYRLGRWFDPYTQHVLKGDYPIFGQHTFLNVSGSATLQFEGRSIPTATTPLAGMPPPPGKDYFSNAGQFVHNELYSLSFDLFHGDAAFKPVDWRFKITPAFGINTTSAETLQVVSASPAKGTVRELTWGTLQEWFGEVKLADLSSEYDFISLRAGSQPFTSDFRGFILADTLPGVRLFGNADGNRTQYNLAYFRQVEKDSATQLNTFHDRDQNIAVANVYRQDFLFPGYTLSGSFHYNNDAPDIRIARNGFQVRPDPVGANQPHRIEAYYLGFAGDGHIDRISLSHAFYWALGRDSLNPLAGTSQSISAQMAALELSYTRDWARFRVSGMWSSGDGDAHNGRAAGFDGIIDNANFGGSFGFWRRQRLPLFGVGLVNDQSLYPNLRSTRGQGQSNFVNPGLMLFNLGADFEVTPRLRSVNNANFLWFDKTNSLEVLTLQNRINRNIGVDLSSGIEYRPILNNNLILVGGLSGFVPGTGFRQAYHAGSAPVLLSGFFECVLAF